MWGYAEGWTDASAPYGGDWTGRSDDRTAAEKALAEENARRMGLPGRAQRGVDDNDLFDLPRPTVGPFACPDDHQP